MKRKANEDQQGTFEWFKSRWGRITGSGRIKQFMIAHIHELNRLLDTLWAEAKSTDQEIEAQFIKEQRAMNKPHVAWGSGYEEEAIRTYQLISNAEVTYSPAFLYHPRWPVFGVSLDFIDITNNRIGEVKCPGLEIHQKTLAHGMGIEHVAQTQLALECYQGPDMKKCEHLLFLSYAPTHPDIDSRLYQEIITRNDKWVTRFREKAGEFWEHYTDGRPYKIKDSPEPTIF